MGRGEDAWGVGRILCNVWRELAHAQRVGSAERLPVGLMMMMVMSTGLIPPKDTSSNKHSSQVQSGPCEAKQPLPPADC